MHTTNLGGVANMIDNRMKILEVILECGNDELKQTEWSLVVMNTKFFFYTKINHLKYRWKKNDLIQFHVEKISISHLIKSLCINDARTYKISKIGA